MNILHVIHDFLPRHRAGSELYAFDLATEQAKRHDVSVLCAEYDPARPHLSVTRRVYGGLAVVELINNWAFTRFEETYRSDAINRILRAEFSRIAPDVVHVHNLLTLSLDLPAIAESLGIPVVATLHDFTLVCPSGGQRVHASAQHVCETIDPERCARCFPESPLHEQIAVAGVVTRNRNVLPLAAGVRLHAPRVAGAALGVLGAVARRRQGLSPAAIRRRLEYLEHVVAHVRLFVAPSRSVADEFERLGIPASKLRVSVHGQRRLLPAARTPSADGRLRLGFVGTIGWHKGLHVLIEAASRLPKDRWELQVFGSEIASPDYVADLRRRSEALPVRFMGPFHQDEAPRVFAGIDVLVVPSLWHEVFGLVVREAFMAGVPVVAARVGALGEAVRHDVDGLLYEARDPADLARALERLMSEDGLRDRLASNAPVARSVEDDAASWETRYVEAGGPAAATSTERVSVLLLTRNGAAHLPALLDRLDAQRCPFEVEVVAVDSGSTDGTLELLRGRVDRVERIGAESFQHGRTRNLGVGLCTGSLVALLVQDAIPDSEHWLSELTAPLREDPRVAGSFARQIARPGASAVTRNNLSAWLASSTVQRRVSFPDPATFWQLSSEERFSACAFDNVSSCVRRSVWEQHPFPEVAIAEDIAWAQRALLAGHHLVYAPRAAVVHSHERSPAYELRRAYLIHRELYRLFEHKTVRGPADLAKTVGAALYAHTRCVLRGPRGPVPLVDELLRSAGLAVAWPLGQYLGALTAEHDLPVVPVNGV